MLICLLGFGLAILVSLVGTPIARQAALKFGIVDRPDGKLKHQKEPVPYLGGLAIYVSYILALGVTFRFSQEVLGLLLAGSIVLLLGLIDDFGVLTPGIKFTGQLIAVFVLIRSDVYIKLAYLPYWLQILLTVLWLVGIMNAFNLMDVMDGLAGGVAAIAGFFLFVLSFMNGREDIALMSAVLCGSLLGFLKLNSHPAKIYMGDAGSLFIGLMLAGMSMNIGYTRSNPLAVTAPVILFGLPIFDTALVIYIRRLRGLSIFRGSNDHFALRLRQWALSVRQTVGLSYAVSAALGGVALAVTRLPQVTSMVLMACTLIAALLVAYFLKQVDMRF